jgi:sodium-dependent multivitamin transporter 6
MNHWDWIVIFSYIGAIIGIATLLARSQRTIEDYYLGGRKVRWWQSGISNMATQLGAISFISAPAFVAIKENGGLKWLCYEFGVPLALIVVMAVIIPALHRGNFISIYEYLEERFNGTTRSLVSILFQLGRGLASAVAVLAGGVVLSAALSISTTSAIILVGIATIIYDVLGGIRIVILSDVLQMMIIIAGIVVCGGAALSLTGWEVAWASLSPERLKILDFQQWGFSSQGEYGFWPLTIGGIFLYASYYGCDQSQVQRQLAVETIDGVRKSLLLNALGRFPIVLLYCIMGVLVGAVITSPEALNKIGSALAISDSEVARMLQNDPDRMVPFFILSFLPHGVIGFIFVAIMAALMSSLDSALNSMSAVTMRDFYQKYFRPDENDRHYLIVSKFFTLFWGIFCVTAALLFAHCGAATRQTTIVLINAVGSLLYGPILAAFILGLVTKGITARAVNIAVGIGVLFNIYLWLGTEISWLWWNVFGFAASVVTAYIVSVYTVFRKGRVRPRGMLGLEKVVIDHRWKAVYLLVGLYFILIIVLCSVIQKAV